MKSLENSAVPLRHALLVSYAERGVNSTEHVELFAEAIRLAGWSASIARLDLSGDQARFVVDRDSESEFDIVHVWTPRGAIWRFLRDNREILTGRLVLHLEDDEDEVLAALSGTRATKRFLERASPDAYRRAGLGHLAHPWLARVLGWAADGVTALSPELLEQVSASRPARIIHPPLPHEWRASNVDLSARTPGYTVIYSGGLHPGVHADFRELCHAVALLSDEGYDVRLLRTGPVAHPAWENESEKALGDRYRDLGFLAPGELARCLRSATVLVQPGRPTVFNRRRFPAKLTSYLASNTPAVLPALYEWIGVQDGVHALLTQEGTAEELAKKIRWIFSNPESATAMAARADEFSRERFDPHTVGHRLAEFYEQIITQPFEIGWNGLFDPERQLTRLALAQPSARRHLTAQLPAAICHLDWLRTSGTTGSTRTLPPLGGPLVSVIVPSYNHVRFLPERLQSIANQTYPRLEVILLDDASTDGSREVLEKFELPFPTLHSFNEVNSGSAFRQWQKGVDMAQGEFVWIAESDDSCKPEFVATLLAAGGWDRSAGILQAQSLAVNEQGRAQGSLRAHTDPIDAERWKHDFISDGREEVQNYLVQRNTIPNASACLIRRTALLAAKPGEVDLVTCGDWLVYARILSQHRLHFVSRPLNRYRVHSSTQRKRTLSSGRLLFEMYFVQSTIVQEFRVPASVLRKAAWFSWQQVQHVMEQRLLDRDALLKVKLLEHVASVDPVLRSRLGERGRGDLFTCISDENGTRVSSLHAWRWTHLEERGLVGEVRIRLRSARGLIQIRQITIRDDNTGQDVGTWSGEAVLRDFRLDGDAYALSTSPVFELHAAGPTAELVVPPLLDVKGRIRLTVELRAAEAPLYLDDRTASPCKRLLLLVPHLELGGADRFNYDLVCLLRAKHGWKVTLVTTSYSENPWRALFEPAIDELHVLPEIVDETRFPEYLEDLIERSGFFTAMICHSEFAYRLLPWLRAKVPQLPFVDVLHIVTEDWKNGGYPRLSIERGTYLTATIVTSEALRNWVKIEQKNLGPPLHVIYTNVDSKIWHRNADAGVQFRTAWSIPAGIPVLLFAGRFADQKQPRLLPEICDALTSRGHVFQLVVVGEGPDHRWLEKNLVLGREARVRLLGPMNSEDMRAVYSASDVLVLPSQAEGIALTLFEALRMEVVPVATDVGGQRELVREEWGRLLPLGPNLAARMAEAIDPLLREPELRKRLAARGRDFVLANHQLAHMAEAVDRLLGLTVDRASRSQNDVIDTVPSRAVDPVAADKSCRDAVREAVLARRLLESVQRQQRNSRLLPRLTSAFAARLRAHPWTRAGFSRFERRFGEALGRIIWR